MKKSFLILLSLVILLSSVLTVVGSATTDDLPDDMYDDDANVTYDAGTTATTKGGILNNVTGDGIGDFVGGVVESVFQDEDVSEQVNDKVEGIGGIFSGIFDGIKDFIPSTNKQTTGSNFFDPINPVDPIGQGSFNTGTGNSVQQNNSALSSTNAAINGEYVDYNTTVIPYAKPTGALNPGDKGDGVKWLQWILIYTECGLQNPITGDYNDATAAAVKNLQLKYGMATVDGIASQEVIEKAEQMYNDYINGVSSQSTSSPAVFNTVGSTTPQSDKKQPPDVAVTIIIVILIIVWIFAIAAVFIIVHIKRKKITLSEDGEIVKPEKPKKSARKTKGIGESVELKHSDTLLSLADESDEPEVKKEVKSLYDRRNDDLISKDKEENEVQQEVEIQDETEIKEKVVSSEVAKTEVQEKVVAEEHQEAEVTIEENSEEIAEDVQDEIIEDVQEGPVQEDETETNVETDEVTFEVLDAPMNFNSFNEFDYSDDTEIKASVSLHEMKQRKLKLEEQAKKDIVNSSDK